MTFFCSSPIFFSKTRSLSQKSEESSPHVSAPIHPACHAIPIPDDLFLFFDSSPIFPGGTRLLSSLKKVSDRHLSTSPPQYTLPVMQYLYLMTLFVVFAHRRFFQGGRVPCLKKVRSRRPSTSPPQYTPACLAIGPFLIAHLLN